MIISHGGNYYPAHYGSTPFTGLSNNYGIGHPSIPPYFNSPFQRQFRPLNPQSNENIISFKLYDLDTNKHSDIIRLIFIYADILYKDKRIKEDEWNRIKDKVVFEQLPILRINNQYKIYHLHAILRYLAREFHLNGITKQDHSIVDIIVETIRPLQEKILGLSETSSDYEETIHQLITDHSNIYLKQLENFYDIFKCQGPFYLGINLSLADFIVYDTINYLIKYESKLLENYPCLREARRRFEKHPRLSDYFHTKKSHHRRKSRHKTSSSSRHGTKSPTRHQTKSPSRHETKSPPPPRNETKSPSHDETKSSLRHNTKSPTSHRTKSPTPNVTFEDEQPRHHQHRHHRHRSHETHKSSHHHHHHHHCRHHRQHRTQSKETTPSSHTKRSSKSPTNSKQDKESTTDVMPPLPPPPPPPIKASIEDISESTNN